MSICYIFFATNNSAQSVVLFFVAHSISKESWCWFWWEKKKVFFQTLRSDNLTNRNTWYFTMFSKYTTLESTFVSEIRPPRIILYKSFLLQEMFKTIMPSGPQLYRVRAKLSIHSFFVRGLSDKYIYRQYNLFVFLLWYEFTLPQWFTKHIYTIYSLWRHKTWQMQIYFHEI